MEQLKAELDSIAKLWKASQPSGDGDARPPVPPAAFEPVLLAAVRALASAEGSALGSLKGVSGPKPYIVFSAAGAKTESRPFRGDWTYGSEGEFIEDWRRLLAALDCDRCTVAGIRPEEVDRILYAAAHYVACAFDMYTGNRASAGKFFEYLTGSFVLALCRASLGALPTLKEPADYSVPVDVVVQSDAREDTLILATKITTRERIVQPFVHHLMVTKAHPGRYKTLILCGSETNRLQRSPGLQETCVAGTIEAYRQTLGEVDGIYYLDLPKKYYEAEFAKAIDVSTIGTLLCERLRSLYGPG